MVDSTPRAVSNYHEPLKWLIPQIDKFLRVRRLIWLGMWYRVPADSRVSIGLA